MFQFRRFPTYAYLIQRRLTEYCSAGFPHSVIPGSKPMCGSPRLIAACHDLLRLLMPRHSPCALFSLTFRRASARHGQRILVLSELCRHQQKFCLAHCFTQFLKLHNLLCPLLLALNTSFCIVQFSRCQPSSLFQDQIETSAPRCFDPFSICGSSFCLLFLSRKRRWWAQVDSNHRPHDYQSCALAS